MNFRTLLLPAILTFPVLGIAGDPAIGLNPPLMMPLNQTVQPDWMTGQGVQIFGVTPHLHLFNALGTSSASRGSLATDHHDPQRNGFTLQSFEPGFSVRWGEHFQAFTTYSAYTDDHGRMEGEWEEYFAKIVDLPGNLELRGGRFLNRFGFQNAVHNHSWFFVNQNLSNGLLLQEGELTTIGGEITWNLPTPFNSALSISGGGLPSHAHAHDHEHGADEHRLEGEDAAFSDILFTANYAMKHDYNDFYQYAGTLSFAYGDNGFERHTAAYGLGVEFLWRQNGYEPGGKSFRWRNELIIRNTAVNADEHPDHEDEHKDHEEEDDPSHGKDTSRRDNVMEFGVSSAAIYGFNDNLEAGIRADYVSGAGRDFGTPNRFRVSPALTWFLNSERTLQCRLQYDYDHVSGSGNENSVWLQIGFNWGGSEVR